MLHFVDPSIKVEYILDTYQRLVCYGLIFLAQADLFMISTSSARNWVNTKLIHNNRLATVDVGGIAAFANVGERLVHSL